MRVPASLDKCVRPIRQALGDGVSENKLQFLNTSELRISEFAFGFSQRLAAGR